MARRVTPCLFQPKLENNKYFLTLLLLKLHHSSANFYRQVIGQIACSQGAACVAGVHQKTDATAARSGLQSFTSYL